MKTRFDLEEAIILTGSFADHIRDIANAVLEQEITIDETINALEGISVLLNIHSKKMYDTMCEALQLNEWRNDV